MAGTPWLGCGCRVAGTICGVGVGVASLGISLMQRDFLLSGTGSLSHTGSFRSAVGRGSSSSSEPVSGINGVISLKVRFWQTSSQNGRILGHLGVKDEIGCWAVVKSAGLKEASVVNMEYTWMGLVICGGSP